MFVGWGYFQNNVVAKRFAMFPVTHAIAANNGLQCLTNAMADYRFQSRSSLPCHISAAPATLETPERLVKPVGAETFLSGLCFGQVAGELFAHWLGMVPALDTPRIADDQGDDIHVHKFGGAVCRAESTVPCVGCVLMHDFVARPQSSNNVSSQRHGRHCHNVNSQFLAVPGGARCSTNATREVLQAPQLPNLQRRHGTMKLRQQHQVALERTPCRQILDTSCLLLGEVACMKSRYVNRVLMLPLHAFSMSQVLSHVRFVDSSLSAEKHGACTTDALPSSEVTGIKVSGCDSCIP